MPGARPWRRRSWARRRTSRAACGRSSAAERDVRAPWTGLLACALVSFALGAAGTTWGLPARWHPDEKADQASRMVVERTLAPDSFINPTLSVYAMVPAIAVQRLLTRAGVLAGPAADPLLAGRLVSAAAGAAAVVVLGLVGGYLAARGTRESRQAAVLAAALLALAPGAVNLTHFATPEAVLLLAVAALILQCVRHVEGRASAAAVGLV